eukprot:scaffold2900_cov64-Phaeocystis_antarctica.AAC.1
MEGRRAPGGPPRHEIKPLSLDSGVLTLSWQPASPCSSGRYFRVEGCRTSADELPTRTHTRGRPARLQTELERRPVPPLSPGAPRSPSRTAVRAEKAEEDKPFTLPSAGVLPPSWGWLWLRRGVTGKPGSKSEHSRRT